MSTVTMIQNNIPEAGGALPPEDEHVKLKLGRSPW